MLGNARERLQITGQHFVQGFHDNILPPRYRTEFPGYVNIPIPEELLERIPIEQYLDKPGDYLDDPKSVFSHFPGSDIRIRLDTHPGIRKRDLNPHAEYYTYDPLIQFDSLGPDLGSIRKFSAEGGSQVGVLFIPGKEPGRGLGQAERYSRLLSDKGFDVWMMTPPDESGRNSIGIKPGGMYISANIPLTTLNMITFVEEGRKVFEFLDDMYSFVVVLGQSLGGIMTNLLGLCVKPNVQVDCLTATDVPRVVWNGAYTGEMRRALIEQGIGFEELQQKWMLGNALNYNAPNLAERHLTIMAEEDEVIPIEHQLSLWECKGKPPSLMLEGGHLALFFQKETIVDFIAGEILGA